MRHPLWPAFSLLLLAAPGWAGGISPARQSELLNMLRHDCGSCHGLSMSGGLGPSLLPEDIARKPDEVLTAAILYGRAGTPMPPWQPFLNPGEACWLTQRLREGLQ